MRKPTEWISTQWVLVVFLAAAFLILGWTQRELEQVETRVERLETERSWPDGPTGKALGVDEGIERWVKVHNNTGAVIPAGAYVYVNGAAGHTATIAVIPPDQPPDPTRITGIVVDDIEPESNGLILLGSCAHARDSSEKRSGKIDDLKWPCCGRDVWLPLSAADVRAIERRCNPSSLGVA